MCGISGYFSPGNFFSEDDLLAMLNAQSHRGPDGSGTYMHNCVGLAHNRLSIIDLSERGAQPMHSADNRYVIVYNGEVYNFSEIAAGLQSAQDPEFQFRSSSDTEVILQAFCERGKDFVSLLNGMFAIAIYDKQEETLHLFRDRIGIKPIYYYWNGSDFAFASEVKALKKVSRLNLSVNRSVLPQYLHLGYIPAPYSIYQGCYKLEAGHYLKVSRQGLEKARYWSIRDTLEAPLISDKTQAMTLMSGLISSAVQYQLKSDVPYGVFLSGGIDSSLVAANAARTAGTRINTFSIGFEDIEHNEAVYARQIAGFLKTDHHEFTVTTNDAIDALDDYMHAYGEPFADSSGIPTLIVSKFARQHVTVTLAGDGGDELFHGYGAYKWAQRLHNPLIYYNRHLISRILKRSSSNRNKRAAEMFMIANREALSSHIFSQEQYFFSTSEIDQMMVKDYLSPVLLYELMQYTDRAFSMLMHGVKRDFHPQEKQALYDMAFYLPDDLLVKVDRASMHHSLETRVPFLDHRVVEQALAISTQLKDKPTAKYLLKEILYQYIPAKYFDRPKHGFSIPLKRWLRKEMGFLINDYLNEDLMKKVGVVKYEQVRSLKSRFDRGEDYLSQRLWVLISLHRWYAKNEL